MRLGFALSFSAFRRALGSFLGLEAGFTGLTVGESGIVTNIPYAFTAELS